MPTSTKQPTKAKKNKYGARATIVDGIRFASRLEAARYRELKAREEAGVISGLERQCRYPVYWPGHEGEKKWLLFTYICDFRYWDADGNQVIEDTKGDIHGTAMGPFRLKCRGIRMAYGKEVVVVTRKRQTWYSDNLAEPIRYYS